MLFSLVHGMVLYDAELGTIDDNYEGRVLGALLGLILGMVYSAELAIILKI